MDNKIKIKNSENNSCLKLHIIQYNIIVQKFPGLLCLLTLIPTDKIKQVSKSQQYNYIISQINEHGKDEMNIKKQEDLTQFLKQINKVEIFHSEKCQCLIKQKTFLDILTQKLSKISLFQKQNNILFTKSYLGQNMDEIKSKYKMKLSCINLGKNIQFLLQIEDLSLQEEIKQLKKVDEYKDSLLSTVVHDLRNPLSSINYLIDECKQHSDFDKIHKDLSLAQANGKILLMLTNDILDYCQNKKDKMKYSIDDFDLNELLTETIMLMNIQASLKQLKIILTSQLPPQCYCLSDRRRLQQVLINLLGNSIKFTNFGVVKLVVYINPINIVNFEIYDSGSGIKPQIQNSLGEQYVTSGTSTNNNNNGVGLGLAISKSIIQYLGPNDSFFVSSKINKGSKFSFQIFQKYRQNNQRRSSSSNFQFSEYTTLNVCCELPSENAASTMDNISSQYLNYSNQYFTRQKQKKQNKISQFKKLSVISEASTPNLEKSEYLPIVRETILIVDDSAFVSDVIKRQLLKINENYNILEASNGNQALEKFKQHNQKVDINQNIKLIIMDVQMPIMNGFESTIQILKYTNEENYVKASIVGMTGLLTNDEQQLAEAAGMEEIFLKPCSFDVLEDITFKYT